MYGLSGRTTVALWSSNTIGNLRQHRCAVPWYGDNCCRQLLELTTGTANVVLKYRAKTFGSIAVQCFEHWQATAPTARSTGVATHAGANVRQHRCAVRKRGNCCRLPDQQVGSSVTGANIQHRCAVLLNAAEHCRLSDSTLRLALTRIRRPSADDSHAIGIAVGLRHLAPCTWQQRRAVPLNAVECWVTKHDHRSQVGLMNHGNWAACADWWATEHDVTGCLCVVP
jgi:hypothetical protein